MSGSASVPSDGATEPNQFYCIVHDLGQDERTCYKADGSSMASTFEGNFDMFKITQSIKLGLIKTDAECIGVKLMCTSYVLDGKNAKIKGLRSEVFIHDLGGVVPLIIIAVAIAIAIIIVAVAIAYQVFKLSPEQFVGLITNSGIMIVVVLIGGLAVLLLLGGSFGASKKGISASGKGVLRK